MTTNSLFRFFRLKEPRHAAGRFHLNKIPAVIFLVAGLCLPHFCAAASGLGDLILMRDGKYAGSIQIYTKEGKIYLDAKRTTALLGGGLYWYPVSGRILININGEQAKFTSDSGEIIINQQKISLPNPVIIRAGDPFLAMEFWLSRKFSDMLGMELAYNDSTRILSADKKFNVGGLNYFSHSDKTRLVLETKGVLEYKTNYKEKKRLDIVISGGILESRDSVEINDGVVRKALLSQERKSAVLSLVFDKDADYWKMFYLKEPDRIVIDILRVTPALPSGDGKQVFAAVEEPLAAEASSVLAESSSPAVDVSTGPAENIAVMADNPVVQTDTAAVYVPVEQVKKRIVIDAGHGGRDPGGRRVFGLPEKEMNLRVAKALADLFKDDGRFDVLLTRDSDVFVPLAQRSSMANEFKADLFISIHANASRSRKKNGFEIYFMSENASDPWAAEVAALENAVRDLEEDAESDSATLLLHSMARNEYINEASQLAGILCRHLNKRIPISNNGVKQAAFFVLRGTYAPAILVETGYMTNSKDQANLCSQKVRKKIAAGIYSGILEYAGEKGWK